MGHNSETAAPEHAVGQELREYIESIEHQDSQIKQINAVKKDIFAEAKARGYDVKVIRKIIAERKRDADDVAEEQAVMELYKESLGMT
jgi:uncharacterized protein (UPF0335 family)